MLYQYGVKREDREHIMPVHMNHWNGLGEAYAYIFRHGGEVWFREVELDPKSHHGAKPLTDWEINPD